LALGYEVLFALALVVWAIFKAYNPDVQSTEKPMEFAFINGILRSRQFPPLDPWMSGFSISYYYFGYLMIAVLTRLSALPPSVAYTLSLVLLFALTVTGAFSIGYNLVMRGRTVETRRAAVLTGLLSAAFVAIIGNLQGALEWLYSHGYGSEGFWRALQIQDMTKPYVSPSWYPADPGWWWWKATRVVYTRGPDGQTLDYTINEFPFFSFMLGDVHPHVLALPFVLMCLGLALSLLGSEPRDLRLLLRDRRGDELVIAWLLPALLLGGLFFLNSWDFPTYTGIVIACYALNIFWGSHRLDRTLGEQVGLYAVAVGVTGILLYAPFYLSFSSQAQGIGLVQVKTQLHHFLIIFGLFLAITGGYLLVRLREIWPLGVRPLGIIASGGTHTLRGQTEAGVGRLVQSPTGTSILAIGTTLVIIAGLGVQGWYVAALLVMFIALAIAILIREAAISREGVFVALLIITACLAALGPEFVHLRDTFGPPLARMNTVFKFYYQAWILLAVASAYGVYYVISSFLAVTSSLERSLRVAWGVGVALLVLASCIYPAMAYYTKANRFQGDPSLDAAAVYRRINPDEYAAIEWLTKNVQGAPVIAEAYGPEYTDAGRIATHTGLPTVLGWGGHELQWRGTYTEQSKREPDIDLLYNTPDRTTAQAIIRKYGIQYVIVGHQERNVKKYNEVGLNKFRTFMDVVFQYTTITIYRVRE